MDDVERMYQHLVRTIRTSFPQYLSQPFEVGELYSTILPYRLHRRELGLETNQDYELALLEMLTGAHGYLVVDDRMRDVLSIEQVSSHPETARIRDFASSHISLSGEALQRLESGGRGSGPATVVPVVGGGAGGAPVSSMSPAFTGTAPFRASQMQASAPGGSGGSGAPGDASRHGARPVTIAAAGDNCPFCKGALPGGRQISFCPHCGQDLTVVHCPACGSELERGWKFCVTCGRSALDL